MKTTENNIRINGENQKKISKHPNILLAAGFWEKDRYAAAEVCYKFMRRIDDMVDEHKADNKTFSDCEKFAYSEQIRNWTDCLTGKAKGDPLLEEVEETIHSYNIPIHLFHDFARAMIFDVNNDGFESMEEFLDYANGASVAPAAIFVHLCCLNKDFSGYAVPGMNLIDVTTPCAVFSYLVHIVRDFEKDYKDNLIYFPRTMLAENGITEKTLNLVAYGKAIPEGFRELIRQYLYIAETYRLETESKLKELKPFLDDRYYFSLNLIYELYRMVFDGIDPEGQDFTTAILTPDLAEIHTKISELSKNANFV